MDLLCCISKTSFTSLNKCKHGRRSVFVNAGISKITALSHLTPVRGPVPFTMVTSWQFRHDGIDIWKGDLCNDSNCVFLHVLFLFREHYSCQLYRPITCPRTSRAQLCLPVYKKTTYLREYITLSMIGDFQKYKIGYHTQENGSVSNLARDMYLRERCILCFSKYQHCCESWWYSERKKQRLWVWCCFYTTEEVNIEQLTF